MQRIRIAVAALTLSVAGFAAWQAHEGDGPVTVRADGTEVLHPYVPTQGDVPTIGHGSTRYEDGTRVTLADPPITRWRAVQLARNLHRAEERRFAASLPNVELFQEEYDLYMDFEGQYGIGNWLKPKSPRTWLLRGDYLGACEALLAWRFQAGRDCRLQQNWGPKGCKGVWVRQQARHSACLAAQ
ncbi:glycoside hydrolase family protein [Variovorax sp. EBFNA2]|uniref:glycoside hydrolase family protein n=1 Tax=Variovorax sp. EBFNA2 TaxID=3342097 RepID=UPI0029C0F2F2|nr:lysozyme [Variovorax boronicumulans]WPG35289.1 lysozyme [Variovorax boronicumulans]